LPEISGKELAIAGVLSTLKIRMLGRFFDASDVSLKGWRITAQGNALGKRATMDKKPWKGERI
jgi:hypothetical protein